MRAAQTNSNRGQIARSPSLPAQSGRRDVQGNSVHALLSYAETFFGQRSCLLVQAHTARGVGSEFVARVLEAAFRQLDNGPLTSAIIDAWPGDTGSAALALRLNAGLHAVARSGACEVLTGLYANKHERFDEAIAGALQSHDEQIASALRHPTQTNEVGRTAAIFAALARLATLTGMPCELLELGSSSGLNLNLARYGYRLGDLALGDRTSPLQLMPEWLGRSPPAAPVTIEEARGVDLNPLDPTDPETANRLMSFVFADQPARLARLSLALTMAQTAPPRVERSNALPWLVERLAIPQREGLCRVIFHSMVLQYFPAEERAATLKIIERAGFRATEAQPIAHIGFEWTAERSEVQLSLRVWPWNYTKVLAICHPYGDWIRWLD